MLMLRNNQLVSATPRVVAIPYSGSINKPPSQEASQDRGGSQPLREVREGEISAMPCWYFHNSMQVHALLYLPGRNCFQDKKTGMGKYSVISLLLTGDPGAFNLREWGSGCASRAWGFSGNHMSR